MARAIYEPEIPGIYAIRNKITNWVYVGKAVRIGRRWDYHRVQLRRGVHFNRYLQNSWTKNGEAGFAFEVVEDLSGTSTENINDVLNQKEAEVLNRFLGKCYNLTEAGIGGVVPGALTRRVMGAAQKRRFAANPHERDRQKLVMTANLDRNNGELRKVISEVISKANEIRWADPKNHKRQSDIARERQSSPEYKARHAATISETWKDEKVKENRMKGIRANWSDPEKRATRLEKSRKTRELNQRLKRLKNEDK